jgi:hypothetical protein
MDMRIPNNPTNSFSFSNSNLKLQTHFAPDNSGSLAQQKAIE